MLVLLRKLNIVPIAITMADPGSEWKDTYKYRDMIMSPWLAMNGFPKITVVSRQEELLKGTKGKNFETLRGCCARTKSLPSVAYPPSKKCSLNYKAYPQRRWLSTQTFAKEVWERGEKLIRCIGYDTDEPRRIRTEFGDPWEHARTTPWYPIFESGMSREDCVALIESDPLIKTWCEGYGIPASPRKSACTFCPNNTKRDWHDLFRQDRESFDDAVAMSRESDSTVENKDVVGLLRFAPKGKRSLHVWMDGGYGDSLGPIPGQTAYDLPERDDDQEEMPCECKD